jgi:hypothetical protein
MWAGSIVSWQAPITSVGTSIDARSPVLSQRASLAPALIPSSLGPCIDT